MAFAAVLLTTLTAPHSRTSHNKYDVMRYKRSCWSCACWRTNTSWRTMNDGTKRRDEGGSSALRLDSYHSSAPPSALSLQCAYHHRTAVNLQSARALSLLSLSLSLSLSRAFDSTHTTAAGSFYSAAFTPLGLVLSLASRRVAQSRRLMVDECRRQWGGCATGHVKAARKKRALRLVEESRRRIKARWIIGRSRPNDSCLRGDRARSGRRQEAAVVVSKEEARGRVRAMGTATCRC